MAALSSVQKNAEISKIPNSSLTGIDETFLLQLPHILCHRIFTHADRMTDGFVTGVALVGLTILAPEQIGIEGDLTKIQTDAEYLVWYHKIVFLCTALGPFVETQFIPPVLS